MDGFMVAMVALLAAVVVGIGTVIYDSTNQTPTPVQVEVTGKFYEGAKSGTGVGITTGGNAAVVMTSSAAKYELVIERLDGTKDLWRTDKKTYLNVEVGDIVDLNCWYGDLYGAFYGCNLQ